MAGLLDDSTTATKHRAGVSAELHPGEQVFFAADAEVHEVAGSGVYLGAVIVTSERLLVLNEKAFGRTSFASALWAEVTAAGPNEQGSFSVDWMSSRTRMPERWKIYIWEGKPWKSPTDTRRQRLLQLSISDARAAVAVSEEVNLDAAYEELKRRRGL